jgi:hypothetical protein
MMRVYNPPRKVPATGLPGTGPHPLCPPLPGQGEGEVRLRRIWGHPRPWRGLRRLHPPFFRSLLGFEPEHQSPRILTEPAADSERRAKLLRTSAPT